MNEDKAAPAPTSAELAAMLEADKQRRAEAARAALAAVCERYGVKLVGRTIIEGERIETSVMVVPE